MKYEQMMNRMISKIHKVGDHKIRMNIWSEEQNKTVSGRDNKKRPEREHKLAIIYPCHRQEKTTKTIHQNDSQN